MMDLKKHQLKKDLKNSFVTILETRKNTFLKGLTNNRKKVYTEVVYSLKLVLEVKSDGYFHRNYYDKSVQTRFQ